MDKNIKKLEEIYVGWKNLIFPSIEMEELAKKRMKICVECVIPNGDGRETDGLDDTNRCKKCKCFMPAKTRSPKAICPLKKW